MLDTVLGAFAFGVSLPGPLLVEGDASVWTDRPTVHFPSCRVDSGVERQGGIRGSTTYGPLGVNSTAYFEFAKLKIIVHQHVGRASMHSIRLGQIQELWYIVSMLRLEF